MAARNADAMNNAQGEFHPRQPRDEPLTTHGVSHPHTFSNAHGSLPTRPSLTHPSTNPASRSATTPPPSSPPKPFLPAQRPTAAPSSPTTSPKSPAKPITQMSSPRTAKSPPTQPLRRPWEEPHQRTCTPDWVSRSRANHRASCMVERLALDEREDWLVLGLVERQVRTRWLMRGRSRIRGDWRRRGELWRGRGRRKRREARKSCQMSWHDEGLGIL